MRTALPALLLCVLFRAAAFGGEEPADARFARAGQLMEMGQLEEAYAILETLAAENPVRWGERATKRMEEIRAMVAERDRAGGECARLREMAAAAKGELAAWLYLESARILADARMHAEALKDAESSAAAQSSRFRPAALLLAARCQTTLGRSEEAGRTLRKVLEQSEASGEERGEAWRELAALAAAAGEGELRTLLSEQVAKGPEEPGAPDAIKGLIAADMVGQPQARQLGQILERVIDKWPRRAVQPEWILLAAKVAEFIDRDWARAEKLYRLVADGYPEACFDLEMLRAGRTEAAAGLDVIEAALRRLERKRRGEIKPLEMPSEAAEGTTPELALTAVLAALRAGDLETARLRSDGQLAEEIVSRRHPFTSYALSDFRVVGSKRDAEGGAEVEYEVGGELGVTRVLVKKARAVHTEGGWKVAGLGL